MRLAIFRKSSLVALCIALAVGLGCAHNKQARMQSADESEREKDVKREKELKEIKTLGDITEVGNAQPIPVWGIGLVTGLRGTGGRPPNGPARAMLLETLTKRNVQNVKALLESPNTSIVYVHGYIPAGANKGDTFDLEITLPDQSKTRSLQGGFLQKCELFNYEAAKNLDPRAASDRFLKGHPLASAFGAVLTGFGEGDEAQKQKQGRIWGGGIVSESRPLMLVLKPEHQKAVMAALVAQRINDTMQGGFQGPITELATAKTDQVVLLRVPHQYRLNMPRYLRVVRLIPLRDGPDTRGPYVKRLGEDLLQPRYSVTAALRLEALGTHSVAPLKDGLQSDHALVRFCAGEALAYLGEACCGEVLARMVEEQPALRAYSLTALASFDDAVSHVKLRELMNSRSAETRYGAFRALRALDENEPSVRGDYYNESFWVHRVAPRSQSMVHVSCSRRPEVVLFGDDAQLQPGFAFEAGEFTVTSARDDDHCTIRRFSNRQVSEPRQCALNLHDVLRTLGEMGAMYPDIVELLRQAQTCDRLSCQMAIDALPQRTEVYQLAQTGADDLDFQKDRDEIRNAEADFTATPTLFERGTKHSRTTYLREQENSLREPVARNESRTAGRK